MDIGFFTNAGTETTWSLDECGAWARAASRSPPQDGRTASTAIAVVNVISPLDFIGGPCNAFPVPLASSIEGRFDGQGFVGIALFRVTAGHREVAWSPAKNLTVANLHHCFVHRRTPVGAS